MHVSCPICNGDAREDTSRRSGDHHWIDCPACGGTFEIGGLYYAVRQNPESIPLPALSALLRHAFEIGRPLPQLTRLSVERLLKQSSVSDDA